MRKGMMIFLYLASVTWTVIGVLIVMGAWNETEKDYEQITGKVSQPLDLSYDPQETFTQPQVVMAKILLEGDIREYRIGGNLYRSNQKGMESIQVGETLQLMIKKTSFIGGNKVTSDSKSASISGVYRPNGEAIIPLERGIAQSKKRLLIGIGFVAAGLIVGIWTYLKN